MPDHIHLAIWSEKSDNVKRFVRLMLSRSSTDLFAMTRRSAERGDPLASRWLQKLDYMHQNPVRSELVEQAQDWEFSSASWYQNGIGLLRIDQIDWQSQPRFGTKSVTEA